MIPLLINSEEYNMLSRIALIILIFGFVTGLAGQDHKRDSLIRMLANSEEDTSRVNILLELGKRIHTPSASEALKFSQQAIELSQELHYKRGLALAYKNAGLSCYANGDYAETINYWQLAQKAFEDCGDKAGVANILSNLGAVYNNFGEDTKALEFYFQAQKAAGEIGDSLRIVTTMINIGTIYLKKPLTLKKAIDIYLAALPIAQALHDNDAIGTTAVNLGEAYYKDKDFPSALKYYTISLKAFEAVSSGSVTYTLTSIGNVYTRQGNFEAALLNQNRALKIAEEKHEKLYILSALLGLADTYTLKKDFPKAIEAYDKAQTLAKEISANFELRDAYKGLAQLHASLADFYNAYKYQALLTEIKDKLYLSSNDNLIKQQQLGFDLVKKEGEVELQKLDLQKQRIIKNSFLAGLILILIIAFIIFRNYLSKVKINKLLDKQKMQIESLLLNILPGEVAQELQENGTATPRDYQSVSVLFTDFKDFSKNSESLTPNELVTELNEYFKAFDNIAERHNLEKIKTIGDSYMCAGGIPTENTTHAIDVVDAAFAMQQFTRKRNEERLKMGLIPWGLRVGVHSGPIIAGVVGHKKYAYDIWGNTVNVASRMESNGEVGKINVSAATHELIRGKYKCEYRGKISAKNIGEVDMYFVESPLSDKI